MRDNFTKATIDTLSKRASQTCSNPTCRIPTTGPHSDPDKFINIGVAAHISAASPGGKRYNRHLSSEQRKGISNALWLCQSCSKLIDTDEIRFPEELLHNWKKFHEELIFKGIYSSTPFNSNDESGIYISNISTIPTGNDDSALLLFEISNNSICDMKLSSLVLEVYEFRYNMPFGIAKSSSLGEFDLCSITKFKKQGIVPIFRVIKPGETDKFSITLSSGNLSGLFCSWNLELSFKTNIGDITFEKQEVNIPSSKNDKEESFDEFKSKFANVYKTNNSGMNWFQRKLTFRRHWFSKGFAFNYMGPAIYYSGPINFLKDV